jgi:hypothetical protein
MQSHAQLPYTASQAHRGIATTEHRSVLVIHSTRDEVPADALTSSTSASPKYLHIRIALWIASDAMSLCQACRRFNVQSFQEKQTKGIPAFIIADGAESGCNFCTFLLDAFMTEHPKEVLKKKRKDWFYCTPILQTSGDAEAGLGLVGMNIRLAALLSREAKDDQTIVQIRTCAELGKIQFTILLDSRHS